MNAAFEGLWRQRSNSRSSYNETSTNLLEPRVSTANKSYSFGELYSGSEEELFKKPRWANNSSIYMGRDVTKPGLMT